MLSNDVILRSRVRSILDEQLVPFWTDPILFAREDGFVGRMDGQNRIDPKGDQGAVYYSRLLWTYSALARQEVVNRIYEDLADRAYDYLQRFFFDDEFGGVFWLLDWEGGAIDVQKRTYAQGFYLYALCEYSLLKKEEWIADDCKQQFDLIQSKTRDEVHDGYLEVFTRDWTFVEDGRLSDKEPVSAKSMNTHLHVIEAFSAYSRLENSDGAIAALRSVLLLFLDKVVDPSSGHLLQTMDQDWNIISKPISFGHDIEASWLLMEAAEKVGEKEIIDRTKKVALRLVKLTLEKGVDTDGGLFNERGEDGHLDDDKHWWPQVEAAVGLVNAWEMTGNEDYLRKALWVWDYFENSIIDQSKGSCFFRVTKEGVPYAKENKIGPWKGPYHSVRACLELIKRCG